jgi:hypothetical protein
MLLRHGDARHNRYHVFTIPTIMTWTRVDSIDCGRVLRAAGARYLQPHRYGDVHGVCSHRLAGWFFGAQAQSGIGLRCLPRSGCRQISGLRITAGTGAHAARRCIRGSHHRQGDCHQRIASGWHRLAGKSVAVHMLGKLKTTVQMVAIPLLLYDGRLLDIIDTSVWGTWLIWLAAVLTVWSMVYYLQKALPEIRARVAK